MKGKTLKVFNNDLYGKTDEREVTVFAVFNHLKYMNKYAIFIFKGSNDNKLYYGSIHSKENSLVIFNVKETFKSVIDEFLNEYTNNKLEGFELIDISNLNKVELIGYNEMEYDKIPLLDEISIEKPKPVTKTDGNNNKGLIWKIIALIVVILVVIGAFIYLNKSRFENKLLVCEKEAFNQELGLNYKSVRKLVFNGRDNLKNQQVEDIYYFRNQSSYQSFQTNGRHFLYFAGEGRTYTYDEETLTLKVTYKEIPNETDLSKLEYQMEIQGYTCKEDVYEE